MKTKFTKMLALIAVLLLSVGNAAAQSATYDFATSANPLVIEVGTDAFPDDYPYVGGTYVTKLGTNKNCDNVPDRTTSINFDKKTIIFKLSGIKSLTINGVRGGGGRTITVTTDQVAVADNVITTIEDKAGSCVSKTFEIDYEGEILVTITSAGGSIYLSEIIIDGPETAPATPAITSFSIGAIDATIDDAAETITAELPFGTNLTAITPVIEFGGSGKSYTPQGAQDFTSPVTYTVFDDLDPNAQSAVSKAYLVTLTAAISKSTDATLDSLAFKEVKLANFAPTTYEYSVVLEPTDAVPAITDVTYTTNYPTATAATPVRTSDTLPTDITVEVTAEDEATKQTYTIHFTQRAASTDATLKALTVNGCSVPEFSTSQLAYTVNLPYNVTSVAVAGTTTDSHATAVVTPAADLQSTASVAVTAEDGLATGTYTVAFTSQPAPTQEYKFWNFSDPAWTVGNVAATETTIQGLTIKGASANTSAIDANGKNIDYYAFTQRFKTTKGGEPTSYLPTARYLSFPVAGDVTITVYGMSGSSGTARNLIVSDGTALIDKLIDNQAENIIKKAVIPYTGPATTIYLYGEDSGTFSVYAVGVVGKLTSTDIATANADKAVKSVAYYDLLGRPAAASTKGIVVVKTVYTNGTASIEKIYQ